MWRGLSLLLLKADGETVKAIADKVVLSQNSVKLCLKKYKEGCPASPSEALRGDSAIVLEPCRAWMPFRASLS